MNEFLKRLITSIILIPVVFVCVYLSDYYLIFFLLIVYLICFYEIIKNSKNLYFIIISNTILIFAFFSFYKLRGTNDHYLIFLFWILITTFYSDIGGYIFGKTFKGKKITKISPNKTYSGSFGSLFLSCFSIPTLDLIQNLFFKTTLINLYNIKYLFLAVLISLICQIGDLYISYIKRKIGIKDTGNFLPGHGGFLDRIDGLIFVVIFIYSLNFTFNLI